MKQRTKRWRVRIVFEPRDLWVGLYWKTEIDPGGIATPDRKYLHLFFCIVPMFPIIFLIRLEP